MCFVAAELQGLDDPKTVLRAPVRFQLVTISLANNVTRVDRARNPKRRAAAGPMPSPDCIRHSQANPRRNARLEKSVRGRSEHTAAEAQYPWNTCGHSGLRLFPNDGPRPRTIVGRQRALSAPLGRAPDPGPQGSQCLAVWPSSLDRSVYEVHSLERP